MIRALIFALIPRRAIWYLPLPMDMCRASMCPQLVMETHSFITHPNGYVTVYGHLREFVPKLMERLRKEQYAKKSFAGRYFP